VLRIEGSWPQDGQESQRGLQPEATFRGMGVVLLELLGRNHRSHLDSYEIEPSIL
jgi:hypothetical protein